MPLVFFVASAFAQVPPHFSASLITEDISRILQSGDAPSDMPGKHNYASPALPLQSNPQRTQQEYMIEILIQKNLLLEKKLSSWKKSLRIKKSREMTLDEINEKLAAADEKINQLANSAGTQSSAREATWWSVTNAMTMSSIVLLFGLLVILLATYLIKSGQNTESVLRIFGTILIIMVSVFLVVAGYNDTQIAPVMGLLGTIVGYLLGKDTKETSGKDTKEKSPQ
ncbi:hypothetical protein [Nitrosospira multiformis]|uniref:Uncharacterized protein n=1 Tax=Nitrosospira multiformis TaxID=1231 RepID=A0A1I7IZN0_9PROT|nr:hypothetical protein [Nitrosospira multiformis]SFU78409.1 hypothetical protein SAMN05216417_1351 [Nitrosospira multiformis]